MDFLFGGMSWAWISYVGVIAIVVWLIWRSNGPRRAIGAGVMLSLLAPEWVRWEITSDVFINVRVGVSACALILYLCHPLGTYNFKLNWCDYSVLGMVGTHILSDTINGGFNAGILLRAYGEWVLPYLAGRVAIQEMSDARWLLPVAVFVACVLVLFGVFEMFMPDRNVFEYLVGQQRPYDDRAPYNMYRMGLQRAYGTTNHPMYWGALLLLLYPWMCYADSRAAKKQGPWFWRLMPYAVVLGVFSSLSRSPLMVVPIVFYVMQMIQHPARRVFWIVSAIVLAVAVFFTWDKVYYGLETISREANSDKMVQIHGKEYRYTGTSHRLLLFVAYGPAVQRTGLLGYGTAKCNTFPPLVPGIDKIPIELIAVDNEYLLLLLRFGYFGASLFMAMGVTATWSLLQMAFRPKAEGAVFLAAMVGLLVAMVFVLSTVWMPFDYGFFYLFCIGMAGGLQAEQEQPLIARKEMELRHALADRGKGSSRRRRRRSHRREEQPDENGDDGDFAGYDEQPEPKPTSRSSSRPDPPAAPPTTAAASPDPPGEPPATPVEERPHGSGRRARERRSRE